MSTGRRRLTPEERRRELLATALQLFAERPADQVSVEDVAAAAGASPALVHHYFGSRPRMVQLVLQATADELIAALEVDERAPAAGQLADGLTIYLDYLQAHPRSWTALLRAGHAADDPTAAIAAQVDDHAIGIALRAVHPARRRPPALETCLRGWLAFVKDVCLRWLDEGTLTREAVQIILSMQFLASLQAAAAADPRAQSAVDRFLTPPG